MQPQHAVDWLIDAYLASDGDIVQCTVAPLTNIAMAMQKGATIDARRTGAGAYHPGYQWFH